MSDEQLRELERRWKDTGTAEDEKAWLSARVRAGELVERDLALAACLGHETSGAVIGAGLARSLLVPYSRVESEAREACAEFVEDFGIARALRVCLPIAWASLEDWSSLFPDDRRPQAALEAAEAWIVCPCERHRLSVAALVDGVDAAGDRAAELETIHDRAVAAEEAASEAEACVGLALGRGAGLFDVVGKRLRASWNSPHSLPADWVAVLPVVQDEVIPWALGYADPVRERVNARQRGGQG